MNAPITPTAPARRLEWLQEQLVALAVACPIAENNPADCPLHDLREHEPEEILDWIEGLSADDAQTALHYHESCFATKMKLPLPVRRTTRAPRRKLRSSPPR